MNVFTELRQEWHSKSPEELLDLSPGILKKIDSYQEDLLKTVLGIESLRDLVNHPELDWVWRTYRLFRAGVLNEMPDEAGEHLTDKWLSRNCGEWLRSSSSSLKIISEDQALQIGRVLGWTSIRDIATDDSLEAARALHRAVTGKPVPPDEEVVKPLKNYFAGSSTRYRERLQDSGEAPRAPAAASASNPSAAKPAAHQEPAMHKPTAAPPPPPAAPPLGAGNTGRRSTTPPLATDPVAGLQTSPFLVDQPAQETMLHKKNYSPSGAYIPKGGGSRGWFEQEGVARSERGNNYRYAEAIDPSGYREVELEYKAFINMRGAERKPVKIQVRYVSGDAPPFPAVCLDISMTGARIRVGKKFPAGEPIQITIVNRNTSYGFVDDLVVLEAKVIWCRSVDLRFKVQRFDCGIHFDEMPLAAKERLTLVLTDRFEDLVAKPLPKEDQ